MKLFHAILVILITIVPAIADEVVDIILDDTSKKKPEIQSEYLVADGMILELSEFITNETTPVDILRELNDPKYHMEGFSLFVIDLDTNTIIIDQSVCNGVLMPITDSDFTPMAYSAKYNEKNDGLFVTRSIKHFIIGVRF